MEKKWLRVALSMLVLVLTFVVIALILRIAVQFSGQVAAQGWGRGLLASTGFAVMPLAQIFGLRPLVTTPYSGVFDLSAALSAVMIIIVRLALDVVRVRLEE